MSDVARNNEKDRNGRQNEGAAVLFSSRESVSTSAETCVPSSPLVTSDMFIPIDLNRREGGSVRASSRSSQVASSRVNRELERLRLEEESLTTRIRMHEDFLRLQDVRRHRLDLEEQEEDEISASSIVEEEVINRTRNWVTSTPKKVDSPPDYREYEALLRQKDANTEMRYSEKEPKSCEGWEKPDPPRLPTMRSPPPLYESKEKQYHSGAQPSSPASSDPISQLTEALKAVITQPQQQLERYMACKTLGKDLPEFSGDVEEWPAFISYYETSTKECKISDSQNLVRLQKSLKKEAREMVRPLLTSPANVKEIIRVLEKHYGQPNTIIKMLMKKIRETPVATEGKPEDLVKIGTMVRNLVQTITSLGKKKYLENPQLLDEMVDKLPHSLRLEWAATMVTLKPAEADMADFSRWLEKVSDAALLLNRAIPADKEEKTKKTKGKLGAAKVETTLAVDEKEKKSTCLFCEKANHRTEECRGLLKLPPLERFSWAKSKNCCFCCLKVGHSLRRCRRKKSCGEDGCNRLHHRILHNNDFSETQRFGQDNNFGDGEGSTRRSTWDFRTPKSESKSSEMNVASSGDPPIVYLEILPVVLYGPKGHVFDYAFCDKGSTASLMDDSLRVELGIDGPTDPLTLRWLDGTMIDDNQSRTISVTVKGIKEKNSYQLRNVRTVKNLMLRVQSVNARNLKSKWKHLQRVPVDDMHKARPRLLIGMDNLDVIVCREILQGPPNAPMATRSKLGWSICGKQGTMKGRVDTNFIFCAEGRSDDDLYELVKASFSLDAIGIHASPNNLKSKDDARAEIMMEQNVRRVNGRYEVPLLWREEQPCLPNNFTSAEKRLHHIERKMDRDEKFASEYCEKIDYYLKAGYARKLSWDEVKITNNITWYLPHFFAYHPNKPGKPRFVFDAAAEYKGTSLNKKLISGPDILKSLPGILMKFRENKIAFTADIKEMFHQVRVRVEDQQAQRFLWRGTDRQKQPEHYVMQVMTFGATCSPFAAQYVKNKNAQEFEASYPEAAKSIIYHHYVDDLAHGAESEEEAIKLIREIIYVHNQGGFDIVKWSCSSPRVLGTIPLELQATDGKMLEMKLDIPVERVLGLMWNPKEDCFQFSLNFNKVDSDIISGERMPTKREVLKTVMSIFDPLGFISHFVIQAKILYQQVWKSNIGWDDVIQDQQQQQWKKWVRMLAMVKNLKLPRHYFGGQPKEKCELHLFCDSSSEAYASLAYFRWKNGNAYEVKFVCAKARVAPLKATSIPRLELQSALLATRLAEFIKAEVNVEISSTYFWTDAKTVILWLRSDSNRYKPFVAHRVGEILEKTNVSDWRWLPTKLNVADEATRSGPEVKLVYDSRWFKGPLFLYMPISEWNWKESRTPLEPETLELKKEFSASVNLITKDQNLPDVARFSSWTKLIRTTAWVRRYVQKKFQLSKQPLSLELTCQDLIWAQKQWWRKVQQECFPKEYAALADGKSLPSGSKILFLSPFMDAEGIIRVTSRLSRSNEVQSNQKFPIILDPSHSYTKLLIMQYHLWAAHQGQEYVINELRQRYWILRMRTAVKSVWNSCLVCQHRKAKPIPPQMGALPEFRVTRTLRAFTECGIDYFGPLTVTKFRRHEKRWVALFTCLHTRAVHLELVDSLSTDSVIMAMIRMSSVRGWPKTFHSDNGTNFRGASAELNKSLKELDQKRIIAELALKEVEWKFIPPSAPHFGGAWERLVRSVKKVLGVLLKEQSPREEVLRTVLAEATNIVNSRPLTYVPHDLDDSEVLTPNCFLFGSTSGAPILAKVEEKELCLRKQWRATQRLADMFWRRWVKEYLPTLTRITKWMKGSTPITKGDVVIIVDENAPRNTWLKGVIEKTYPGKDGIVRVADVRTKNGTFRRPTVKLCVLPGTRGPVPDVSGTAGGSMLANADDKEDGSSVFEKS